MATQEEIDAAFRAAPSCTEMLDGNGNVLIEREILEAMLHNITRMNMDNDAIEKTLTPPSYVPVAQGEPVEHIMQFFTSGHLPSWLQEVAQPFEKLARLCVETLPRNPERSTALRKLLEAKDAAVRARLAK